jgi:hypothetical protein
MLWLTLLEACCCTCCTGGPAPVRVPPSHAGYVGTWVCRDGDTREITPDGVYQLRSGDVYEDPWMLSTYAEGRVDGDNSVSLLGIRFERTNWVRLGVAFTADNGQVCVEVDGVVCARASPVPAAAVGLW